MLEGIKGGDFVGRITKRNGLVVLSLGTIILNRSVSKEDAVVNLSVKDQQNLDTN